MKLDVGDIADFAPIIRATVRSVLDEIQSADAKLGNRLAYPEAEAATLLGIAKHSLRDLRLSGQIRGRLAGKRIVYARSELLRFLAETDA